MYTAPSSRRARSRRYDPAVSPGQGRTGPRTTAKEAAKRPGVDARRLTAERLRRGLTQEQAAELVGVNLSTWQRWETASAPVRRGKLAQAAVARFLAGQ